MGTGPVAETILFMMLFAALIVVGVSVLAYLARCMLVIVQETGVGHDEVIWPNEPIQDWLVHAVLFIELLGIWLMPAGLIARILRHDWLPDQGALRVLLLAGPGLWLFFPIGLLSSLSAQSRWVPFRWAIFLRFLRIAPAALGFYFVTALLLGAAVVPWYYALIEGWVLLPVAAAVSAAVVFIYARLIGRIAWLIQRLPSKPRASAKPKVEKRPPPKSSRKSAKPGGKKKRKPAAEVQDPWAVPDEERSRANKKRFPWAEEPPQPPKPKKAYTPPRPEEIEGYGIAAEEPAAPKPPPEKPTKPPTQSIREEYEPIDVRLPDAEASSPLDDGSGWFAEQVRQRIAERERVELPPSPHPLFSGVYTFPWYANCLPNWLSLSLALLVVGGIVRGLVHFGGIIFKW
jgi:hypothetical protein